VKNQFRCHSIPPSCGNWQEMNINPFATTQ